MKFNGYCHGLEWEVNNPQCKLRVSPNRALCKGCFDLLRLKSAPSGTRIEDLPADVDQERFLAELTRIGAQKRTEEQILEGIKQLGLRPGMEVVINPPGRS